MGWISPSAAQSLSEQFMILGKYKRLEVIGELSFL
jgi:L-asparaginase